MFKPSLLYCIFRLCSILYSNVVLFYVRLFEMCIKWRFQLNFLKNKRKCQVNFKTKIVYWTGWRNVYISLSDRLFLFEHKSIHVYTRIYWRLWFFFIFRSMKNEICNGRQAVTLNWRFRTHIITSLCTSTSLNIHFVKIKLQENSISLIVHKPSRNNLSFH